MEAVPLDDRGLLLGDGLFETLLWKDGALVLTDAHAARMADGAAVLGLPAPSFLAFIEHAHDAVTQAELMHSRAAVRITLTAGSGGRGLERPSDLAPRLFATAAPSTAPQTPAALIVAGARRNEASPTSRLKTLAYLDNVLARREALAAGADEAVMLNTRGEVAGAAAANLFWVRDGVLFTPAPETGRLDGIMARQVRTTAASLGVETREVRDGAEALAEADALFLTNSLIGVRAAHMAERAFAPHALVQRLAGATRAFA